jgi:hypothetical protein
MKLSKQYVPAVLDLFKSQITPLKVAEPTAEQSQEAVKLIAAYSQRLQLLDLSLSAGDAIALLKKTYQSI